MRALPVLFLHHLGSGHFFDICFFKRRLDPELELRCGGKGNISNIGTLHSKTADIRVLLEKSQKTLFDIRERVCQHGTRVNAFALMDEEGWDAQGTDGLFCFFVVMLEVIVDEPIYRRIHWHIDFRIVQRSDSRQYDGGPIRLYCCAGIELIHILEEDTHRYLLVRIIAGHIDADERDELDFRMCLECFLDVFPCCICGNHIQ